jgi:UDP-N-acetylmuramoyl-L-alanyl-D-glutamate--2,6-diaminopimelate ligase
MRHLRRTLLKPYHYAWAVLSAKRYRFPARSMTVVAVTGTKGKSSVSEILFHILSHAGHKTALAGTIRFAVGNESRPNLFKMTMPGRGFIQRFLADALRKGATHAVIEMTSEAALVYRHKAIDLDALVFTNLQKEHVESHGSMENYLRAKLSLGDSLVHSVKRPRIVVANSDDPSGSAFLALPVDTKVPFSSADASQQSVSERGVSFTYGGVHFSFPQPGAFSLMNALAAIKTAEALGVPLPVSAEALERVTVIPGRAERIEAGQPFTVLVDYAHTPDSLQALYDAFPNRKKIAVLGNTGGGRDTWKRPEMARIAEKECERVILTNEDPYDEDPRAIIDQMAAGMQAQPEIILDRRAAIRRALELAHPGEVVFITGKGTDPFIMGARGAKEPWSDARVAREELAALLRKA